MKINGMNKSVKDILNYLIVHHGYCALFEFKNGMVRLLLYHHRYANPYKKAPRVNVAKCKCPKGVHMISEKYLYASELIK